MSRIAPLLLTLFLATFLGACATNSPTGPVYDPYENTNRKIYKFNDALDRAILKPVAKGYQFVLPDFVETGVSNFFNNIDDVSVVINDLLQGKFRQAGWDGTRLFYNLSLIHI